MKNIELLPWEKLVYILRELYDKYGYSRYKMNKFEEYDLYARNKDFLISDSVITFTDTNGKLLALKPDVTLSIVKNTKDSGNTVQKLYYNENVYRVSKGTHSFKELTQVGLEAIGNIDEYTIFEVIYLASQSLDAISDSSILEISHLGILSDVLNYAGVPSGEIKNAVHFIGEKNVHELKNFCENLGIENEKSELLCSVAKIYDEPKEALEFINKALTGIAKEENLKAFETVITALKNSEKGNKIRIDFSVVDDLRYYNGFVFKGFSEGVPTSVLSGGQYDALMKNMKRRSGAIGFAVYLDVLENRTSSEAFDVDILLTYGDEGDILLLKNTADEIRKSGESVLIQKEMPEGIKYKKLMTLAEGEVKLVENNA